MSNTQNYNMVGVLLYSNNNNNNKIYLLGRIRNTQVWGGIQISPDSSDANTSATASRAVIYGTNNFGYGWITNNSSSSVSNIRSRNLIPVNAAYPTPFGLEQYPREGLVGLGTRPMVPRPMVPRPMVSSPVGIRSSVLHNMQGGAYMPISVNPAMGITQPSNISNIIKSGKVELNPMNLSYLALLSASQGIDASNIRINRSSYAGTDNRIVNNRMSLDYRSATSYSWLYNSLQSNNSNYNMNVNGQNIKYYKVLRMPYDTSLPTRFENSLSALLSSNRLSQYDKLAWVSQDELSHVKANCDTNRTIPSLNNDQISNQFCQVLKNMELN
jgi:hypothetical protein